MTDQPDFRSDTAAPSSQAQPPVTAEQPQQAKPASSGQWPPPSAPERPVVAQPTYVQGQSGRGGFGRGFGAGFGFALGLGVVLTVSSIITTVIMMASLATLIQTPAGTASTQLETIWGPGSAKDKLRAVQISGTILAESGEGGVLGGGTYGYEVADMIRELDADEAAGLVLLVNTPGGSVTGSAAIANAVSDYKQRTGKPVLVHVSSMSASGGVYSTSSADEIWVDEGAMVGSIGVFIGPISRYENVTGIGSTILQPGVTAERVEQEFISAGRGKVFGNPFAPADEAVKKQYQELIDEDYANFVERVAQGRGINPDVIRNEMGAAVFAPDKAKAYGLINGVKGRDEFFRYAAEKFGVNPNETKVEMVAEPGPLAELLGAKRAFGASLPVEQGPGIVPPLNSGVCNPQSVVVYHGSLHSVCG